MNEKIDVVRLTILTTDVKLKNKLEKLTNVKAFDCFMLAFKPEFKERIANLTAEVNNSKKNAILEYSDKDFNGVENQEIDLNAITNIINKLDDCDLSLAFKEYGEFTFENIKNDKENIINDYIHNIFRFEWCAKEKLLDNMIDNKDNRIIIFAKDFVKKNVIYREKGSDNFFVYNNSTGIFEYFLNKDMDRFVYEATGKKTLGITIATLVKQISLEIKEEKSLDDFDKDTRYIAFNNGILDCLNNVVIKPSADFMLLKKYDFDYKSEEYNEFDEYLKKFFSDEEVTNYYALEIAKLCTNYKASSDKVVNIIVSEPNTGKSTFLRIVCAIIGQDNTAAIDEGMLKNSTFAKGHLMDKKLIYVPDARCDSTHDTTFYKQITGNDGIVVDEKYQKMQTKTFSGRVLIISNAVPKFSVEDEAMIKRINLVFLTSKVKNKDKRFYEKMIENKNEIVNHLITKYYIPFYKSMNNGEECDYESCAVFKNNQNMLLMKTQTVRSFANEHIVVLKPNDKRVEFDGRIMTVSKIYEKYCDYCFENDLEPVSNQNFNKELLKIFNSKAKIQKISAGYVYSSLDYWEKNEETAELINTITKNDDHKKQIVEDSNKKNHSLDKTLFYS